MPVPETLDWAAIILDGTCEEVLSGGKSKTTNNRMEMTGVIRALEILDAPFVVELYSDSAYVIDGLREGWAGGWKARSEMVLSLLAKALSLRYSFVHWSKYPN